MAFKCLTLLKYIIVNFGIKEINFWIYLVLYHILNPTSDYRLKMSSELPKESKDKVIFLTEEEAAEPSKVIL